MNPEINTSRMKPTDALVLLGLYELGGEGELVLTSDLAEYIERYGAVNSSGIGPMNKLGSMLVSLKEQGLIVHNKTMNPSKGDPGQRSSATLAPGVLEMIETGDTLEELRIRAEATRRRRDIPTG